MNKATRHIAKLTSMITVSVAVFVLVGWFFTIPVLKIILPVEGSMKFNTALCFLLSGIALFLSDTPAMNKQKMLVVNILAGIVLLIAGLTLAEYIFKWDAGIDQLFLDTTSSSSTILFPGRMSQISAVTFMLLGLVFLLLQKSRFHLLIQVILIAVIVILTLTLIVIVTANLNIKSFNFIISILSSYFVFLMLFVGTFFSYPLSYLRFSFHKKIAGYFVLTILVLVIIFLAISSNNSRTKNTTLLLNHTNEVLLQNQHLLNLVRDLDIGAMRFIITGNEDFLTSFTNALPLIPTNVQDIRELTKDDTLQQLRIDTLEKLISSNINVRKQIIEIRRDKGFGAASHIFKTGITKNLMEQLRTVIAAIENDEYEKLKKNQASNEQNTANSSKVIILFQIISGLLLLTAFLIIYNNTRARNKAEEELQKFKHFFNNSNDFSCIANVEGYFEILNPNFEKILGYSEEELLQNQFLNFIHPDDIAATLQEVENLKTGALTIHFVNRYRKKNGDYLWFDWNTTPDPVTGKLYAIARDVTERKILEERLKQFNQGLEKQVAEKTKEVIEREKQYRFLLENMREGIQVIGFDWRYLFVNNAVVEQGKYSNEELLGHTMMEKYPGIENTELFKVLQQCMKERTAKVFENEFSFPDGTKEWFELSIQPVPEGIFILSMDITERKKIEEDLMKSLKEISDYKYAINESSIIAFTDHRGIITYVNDNFCKISKYSSEELIGQDHRIINSSYHPKEFIRELWVTIANGKTWRGEFKNKAKDETFYWVDATIVPFLNDKGKPFQYLAIRADITKRKEAEEAIIRLNETLEKKAAELLASNQELERFAYIASHDLQEPLRMVSSFLNLLAKELEGKLDATSTQYFDFALDGSQRMKQLIQDLLQFSRVGTSKEAFKEINCNEMLSSLHLIFKNSLSESGGSLRINPLPVIKGFPSQLQQVFQNLIGNAIKYHDSRPPEIEVGCEEKKEFWQFYVKDNGIGIDPKFFDKIFIIFQRLHNKTEYSGTGIGLSICKKIVEKHGGRIWVESEAGKARQPAPARSGSGGQAVGRGSTFYFTISKNIV